jgi:hypothetical protein
MTTHATSADEVLTEWERGCSSAEPGRPLQCAACTQAAIGALRIRGCRATAGYLRQHLELEAMQMSGYRATFIIDDELDGDTQ